MTRSDPGPVRGCARATPPSSGVPDAVEALDEQIISMVLCRAEVARQNQAQRRNAGLPARELALERQMLRRYVARLGKLGSELARSVLSLSQRPGRHLGSNGMWDEPAQGDITPEVRS